MSVKIALLNHSGKRWSEFQRIARILSRHWAVVLEDGAPSPEIPLGVSVEAYRRNGRTWSSMIQTLLEGTEQKYLLLVDGRTIETMLRLGEMRDILKSSLRTVAVSASNGPAIEVVPADRISYNCSLLDVVLCKNLKVWDSRERDTTLAEHRAAATARSRGYTVKQYQHPLIVTAALERKPSRSGYPQPGDVRDRPWSPKGEDLKKRDVTIAIPTIHRSWEDLLKIKKAWLAQVDKPLLRFISTGGPVTLQKDLLDLEDENTEVELFRFRGRSERWDYQAAAISHVMADCPTEYLLLTHDDVCPTNPTLISDLIARCNETRPVVGYSDESGDLISSALCLMHMPTISSLRLTNDPRWLKSRKSRPEKSGNALDSFRHQYSATGLPYLFIGKMLDDERSETLHLIHAGGDTYAGLYGGAAMLDPKDWERFE